MTRFWIGAYSRLIELEEQAIDLLDDGATGSAEVKREIDRTDLPLLRELRAIYGERLEYWRLRDAKLRGAPRRNRPPAGESGLDGP